LIGHGRHSQPAPRASKEDLVSLLLLIVVLLLVFGGLPNWGYHNYGYGPSGIGGIILIILIILLLTGRLNF
jgi:hypothetical protein